MNKIHFVIKRLANIKKYLEQKRFLGKIASIGDFVSVLNPNIPSKYILLCKADITKKQILQKVTQSLCQLLFIK